MGLKQNRSKSVGKEGSSGINGNFICRKIVVLGGSGWMLVSFGLCCVSKVVRRTEEAQCPKAEDKKICLSPE